MPWHRVKPSNHREHDDSSVLCTRLPRRSLAPTAEFKLRLAELLWLIRWHCTTCWEGRGIVLKLPFTFSIFPSLNSVERRLFHKICAGRRERQASEDKTRPPKQTSACPSLLIFYFLFILFLSLTFNNLIPSLIFLFLLPFPIFTLLSATVLYILFRFAQTKERVRNSAPEWHPWFSLNIEKKTIAVRSEASVPKSNSCDRNSFEREEKCDSS